MMRDDDTMLIIALTGMFLSGLVVIFPGLSLLDRFYAIVSVAILCVIAALAAGSMPT